MLHKDDLGRLLDYTVWANRRVLRAAATLTAEQFRSDGGSSHGGVRGTLTHIMGGEWIWLERFKGVSPERLLDEGEFLDIIALRERWKAVEQHRAAWFRALHERDVAATVHYVNTEGRAFEAPLWQLVQHVVNHSTYHRGQVVTLLRPFGVKLLPTDLVLWDRENPARKARAKT
jgi:uncharacterized damage-inducible protein DinB